MRNTFRIHALVLVLAASALSACSNSPISTQPLVTDEATSDRTTGTPTASPTRPGASQPGPGTTARPDTAVRRLCRADNELTEREIAQIRALYNAYLDAIADDLRLIEKVNQEAREAAQAGASREKIAAILARADEAKRNVAAATRRLRAAISDILHDDRLPCFVVPVEPAA